MASRHPRQPQLPEEHPRRRARSITSLVRRQESCGGTVLSILISAYQVRWRAVEERIATHPHEAAILDKATNTTILYTALSRRNDDYPPYPVVRSILRVYPLAIWNRYGGENSTLLEIACSHLASLDTLQLLTSARPSIPEDASALSTLWDAYCVNYGDEKNFVMILQDQNSPEAWEIGCKFQLLLKYVTSEYLLPFSIQTAATSDHCSVELFNLFWKTFPDRVSQQQQSLLHFASFSTIHGTSWNEQNGSEKADFILKELRGQTDSETSDKRNADPRMNQSTVTIGSSAPEYLSPKLLKFLNNAKEYGLYEELCETLRCQVDSSWHQLIGVAKAFACPPKLVELLIEMHPEMLLAGDENEMLPLHHAVATPHHYQQEDGNSRSILAMLLHREPNAVRYRDIYGRTPFHIACLVGRGTWVIDILWQCNPEALYETDHQQGLPPVLLAATSKRSTLDMVSIF